MKKKVIVICTRSATLRVLRFCVHALPVMRVHAGHVHALQVMRVHAGGDTSTRITAHILNQKSGVPRKQKRDSSKVLI